jgi:hypothetical protein
MHTVGTVITCIMTAARNWVRGFTCMESCLPGGTVPRTQVSLSLLLLVWVGHLLHSPWEEMQDARAMEAGLGRRGAIKPQGKTAMRNWLVSKSLAPAQFGREQCQLSSWDLSNDREAVIHLLLKESPGPRAIEGWQGCHSASG